MFKFIVKFLFLYISVAFIYSGYLFLSGEDKPWYCISKCDSSFDRWSSAIPYFGFGILLLWRMFKGYVVSFYNKPEKLIKKGKYCFKKTNFKEPYCCKCYEENGVVSKLKKVDDRYLCMYCDYTELYIKNNGIEDISVKQVIDNAKKL